MRLSKFGMAAGTVTLLALGACASMRDQEPRTDISRTEGGTPVVAENPGSQGPVGRIDWRKKRLAELGRLHEVVAEQSPVVTDTTRQSSSGIEKPSRAPVVKSRPTKAGTAKRRHRAAAAPVGLSSEQRAWSRELALNHLHHVHQTEIEMAGIAKERSVDPKVHAMADRIIADHRALEEKVEAVAKEENVKLHAYQAATYEEAAMDKLRSLNGKQFDEAYTLYMSQGHKMTLQDLRTVQAGIRNGQIRSLIREAIPSVERHQRMARTAGRSVRM